MAGDRDRLHGHGLVETRALPVDRPVGALDPAPVGERPGGDCLGRPRLDARAREQARLARIVERQLLPRLRPEQPTPVPLEPIARHRSGGRRTRLALPLFIDNASFPLKGRSKPQNRGPDSNASARGLRCPHHRGGARSGETAPRQA